MTALQADSCTNENIATSSTVLAETLAALATFEV